MTRSLHKESKNIIFTFMIVGKYLLSKVQM